MKKMVKSVKAKRSFSLILLFMIIKNASGQPGIEGPLCVTSGITYQYMIKDGDDPNSSNRICIEGGLIEGSQSNCVKGSPSSILVVWNESISEGSISIETPKGNSQWKVAIAKSLQGGLIDSSFRSQRIDHNSIPQIITCSSAEGGSCSAAYVYQWQTSSDCLNWANIPGATDLNMTVRGVLKQTSYYRRRVIERISKTEQYSDVAIVFVNPDMKNRQ